MNTKDTHSVRTDKRENTRKDSDTVYTQPKPFRRKRFFLHLATVIAVVLAIVLGMAIFFKVHTVTVSGAEKYSQQDILQASGIKNGDNLLTLSKPKISGKIMTALPYVKSVRIGVRLPDTVNIEIEELELVYSIQAEDGSWWLISAAGRVVDETTVGDAKDNAVISGVQLTAPVPGQMAVAAEPAPAGTDGNGETIPVLVTGKEQLDAAIAVLTQLESHGILGQLVGLDVTDIKGLNLDLTDTLHLDFDYTRRFHVYLGDVSRMDYKIASMEAAVAKIGTVQQGELDVSFTTWPDEVGFTPFE